MDMRGGGRRTAGASLAEMLACLLILSFAVASVSKLMTAGLLQQQAGRERSDGQDAVRKGVRLAVRSLRHGFRVVASSTSFGSAQSSSASQVIVEVPQPSGSNPSKILIRLYRSANTLYLQRSDQPGSPVVALSGITSLTVSYYLTSGTTRTPCPSSPSSATDLQLTVRATSGSAIIQMSADVTMRNALGTAM